MYGETEHTYLLTYLLVITNLINKLLTRLFSWDSRGCIERIKEAMT